MLKLTELGAREARTGASNVGLKLVSKGKYQTRARLGKSIAELVKIALEESWTSVRSPSSSLIDSSRRVRDLIEKVDSAFSSL